MRAVTSSVYWYLPCLLLALIASVSSPAQTTASSVQVPSRIVGPVDESSLTTLKGNVYPLAIARFDRGAAPYGLPLERMLLVLKRSPEQEQALQVLLLEQQDRSSPYFHQWLAPEEFGRRFGPSDQDVQTVVQWLQMHAFQVGAVSAGRTVIEFSGTAGMVKQAFHTEIHKYAVGTEEHWANASDPQIPTALTPVVAGVSTLNSFPRRPMSQFAGVFSRSKATGKVTAVKPEFTFPYSGCSATDNCYAVGPYDFAIIYNTMPVWNAGVDGSGQSIAIVGQTDIHLSDVQAFRAMFGLPANDPQIIYDGPNPGVNGDEGEADIDVQWSGAVAPRATIKFVTSQSTETTSGVDLSSLYIVDNNLAPIMSVSYGLCEAALGTATNQFYNHLWEQAAAQGISVFVASGDNGSAGCDFNQGFVPQPAKRGLAVSGLASTPYNVAVGGTDFNDFTNPTLYWNSTNSTNQSSAKGYVPESTWNDSCTSQLLTTIGFSSDPEANCNNTQLLSFVWTVAGSGGASALYAKPSWQKATGVPSDGKRDLPDVSLFASNGFVGHFYIVCQADTSPAGTCDLNYPYQDFAGYGGTSVASPAFAGIMALVTQKAGARQGNPNFVLYKLSGQSGASCPSSSSEAASCIFNDVTVGTIAMPCTSGTTNCTTKSSGHAYGILSGYGTTAGYDLATGLGSVNAANLVNKWSSVSFLASQTTLTLTPTSGLTHGQSVNFTIQVKPASGTGTPSGGVSLLTSTGQSIDGFNLQNGQATGTTTQLPGGSYSVTAQYGGDGTYGTSQSTPVSVTVAKENSVITPRLITFDWSGNLISSNATSAAYGSPYVLRGDVTNSAGTACGSTYSCATGNVTLTDNGSALDGGTFTLNSLGYFEDGLIQLSGGTHTLKAQYPGDASFNASTGTSSVTITPASTATSVSGPGNIQVGNTTVISSTTQAQSTGAFPSGTVTFTIDGKPVTGTPTYSTSQSGNATVVLTATMPASVSTGGTHTLVATYNGDANYVSSSSSTTFTSFYATTTMLSANPTAVQFPGSVTVTALIDTPSKTPTPTGTVRFSGSQGQISGPVSYTSVTDGSGNAALQASVTYSPSYTEDVFATYSGDSNYGASASQVLTVTVNGGPDPTFTLPQNQPAFSVSRGIPGTGAVSLGSLGGFSGSVALTCAVPAAMKEATCSIPSPLSVGPGGATAYLTVSTTAPHQIGTLHRPAWMGDGMGVLFAAMLIGGMRRKKFPLAVLLIVLLALALASVGCGGGSGGGGQTDPGTPTGTYAVVVTGTSGSITQTTNVSVTVQ
jgi:hypothetical protein